MPKYSTNDSLMIKEKGRNAKVFRKWFLDKNIEKENAKLFDRKWIADDVNCVKGLGQHTGIGLQEYPWWYKND